MWKAARVKPSKNGRRMRPKEALQGFGSWRGAGRKWARGQAHAYWAASAPPPFRVPPLLHRLPGSAAALAPTSGHPLWQAPPLSAPPPASPPPPPAGGGDGLQRRWWRFRYPKSGARSRSRGRRPGYDRGSLASRSGQPESSSRLLPVPERSPQPGPTARFAAAPPARPL